MMTSCLAAAAAWILLSAPAGFSGGEGSLAAFSGVPVLEVRVAGTDIPRSEVRALLPQHEGEALDPGAVREGIRNLYLSGRYRDVTVLAKRAPDGVIILYEVVPRTWLSEILFEGNLSIRDGELLRNTDLSRKEEISDKRLRENARRIRDYYAGRGFLQCEVSFRVESGGGDQRKVVFQIREGVGGVVSDVRLNGNAGISRTKLLSIVASMPGEELDGRTVEKDVEKLSRYFHRKSFLASKIRYSLAPDPEFPGGTVVTFTIDRGPLFFLSVRTPDVEEEGWVVKRMKKIFRTGSSIEVSRQKFEKELISHYKGIGYPFAVTDWTEDFPVSSERRITIILNAGTPVTVDSVKIRGVEFFPEAKMRETILIGSGMPFVKADLEEEVEALERAYKDEGFLEAKVSLDPLNFIPAGDVNKVQIGINVREGPRTMIRELAVRSDSRDPDHYIGLIKVNPGDPYVPEAVERAREAILSDLSADGYLYATVSLSEPVRQEDNRVDIVLTVHEGPRVHLGTVIVLGNKNVSTRIIRMVLDLTRGDVLTQDKILKAQERIYRLGVMSSVDVRIADSQEPSSRKDIIVTVRERPRYVIGLRVGYGSEDRFRGEASVTHRNVAGMARSLTLKGKTSAIERRVSLVYNHPWFSSRPIDMSASLSDIVEERDSYSRDAYSAAVDFTREMSERTKISLGYVFEGLRLFDVSPGAQLSSDDEGKTDVAALFGEAIFDSRDDFLDPWSGLLGDIRLELASSKVASRAEHIKFELASHRYVDMGNSLVYAGLLRLGTVNSYGRSEEVIISKRFFLGGHNSVRGYALDGLGPRDADDEPIGGNYMLNINMELRYPVYRTLRGVGFVDSGSVWLQRGGEGFHLRSSAGAGLRWSSPIGPLSLDYGYKLNPADQDADDRYRWHFSIGHAF